MKESEINKICDQIEEFIETGNDEGIEKALSMLDLLRYEYRKEKDSFVSIIPRLEVYEKKIHEYLLENKDKLVSKYTQIAMEQRALLRKLKPLKLPVIELCKIQGGGKVSLCSGQVIGLKKRKVTLPPPKTPQRNKLLEILKKNDIYEEYTILSTTKLKTVHENDEIEAESLRDISSLIPVTETYYLYPSKPIISKREQVEKDVNDESYNEGYADGKKEAYKQTENEYEKYEAGYEEGYDIGLEEGHERGNYGPEEME